MLTTSSSVTDPNPAATATPQLRVTDLSVATRQRSGDVLIVDRVSLEVASGETVGVVGESGSGKTMTALAIMGLVPHPSCSIVGGQVLVDGRDLVGMPREDLNRIRGGVVSMVFQEPRRSLDPCFTVGSLISEVARRHLGVSRKDAWRLAVETMDRVGIPNAERRAHDYPQTFSGGMCQRVMIAMAIVSRPRILIADEPTTALDVTVQARVLDLINEIQRELGLGVVFITHDLGVVSEMCDRVTVLYAGHVVEESTTDALFAQPQHPYTARLLGSLPQMATGRDLGGIPGEVASPGEWPKGCRFHPRCEHAQDPCRDGDVEIEATPVGSVRCVRHGTLPLEGLA